MSKEPKDYKPSPWLKEDLTYDKVRMPPAIVSALYQLQKDRQEVEYGGAIDFELIKKKPAVERVLSYTGIVEAVPASTWAKVFLNPDVELTFHTHPGQKVAIPSEGDIIFFMTTPQKAMLIFAGEEAILLTKGANTPPDDYCRQHMEYTKSQAAGVSVSRYDPQTALKEQQQMVKELKDEIDIDCVIFPVKEPIDITIKIVQDIASGGRRPEIFR